MQNMQPFISINKKEFGKFTINRAAVSLFQLQPYERVEIFQNKATPTVWQMTRVENGGFFLKAKDGDADKGLFFTDRPLAERIFKSIGFEDYNLRVPVVNQTSANGWQWILLTNTLLD